MKPRCQVYAERLNISTIGHPRAVELQSSIYVKIEKIGGVISNLTEPMEPEFQAFREGEHFSLRYAMVEMTVLCSSTGSRGLTFAIRIR